MDDDSNRWGRPVRAMFAYIDAGTGATLMQLVLAGTVGIGAIIKLKWRAIRGVFSGSDDSETLRQESQTQLSDKDDERFDR